MSKIIRQSMIVTGQVQGVGFRPFVYRYALKHELTGCVANTLDGVEIQVQGSAHAINSFIQDFHANLPPLALLNTCTKKELSPCADEKNFIIAQTFNDSTKTGHKVIVSPDVALCQDCLSDINDINNRRYNYPFTNCTNCGPRYTITHNIPYDRNVTSMACFEMCDKCLREYNNPLDRRFHAQPNACAQCGPKVFFVENVLSIPGHNNIINSNDGYKVDFSPDLQTNDFYLQQTALALLNGKIVAIKGLGGFHLACNAFSTHSIEILRLRKNRPHKAFALMLPNLQMAHQLAFISKAQEKILNSMQMPIVICRQKPQAFNSLITPDGNDVGIMLPFTPLHQVLFKKYVELCQNKYGQNAKIALIMTSANAGGDPICLGNREALQKLSNIADAFLLHNRDILIRADDSVIAFTPNLSPIVYRRARGYVPSPIILEDNKLCVLALGAELKSTICLTKENTAFISQHIGDLTNFDTFNYYKSAIKHLQKLLKVKPQILVCDLHPNYLSSDYANEISKKCKIKLLKLQHHAAHGFSVLAEHNFKGKALVWTLDGTGYGEQNKNYPYLQMDENKHNPQKNTINDNNIIYDNLVNSDKTDMALTWGGELLLLDTTNGQYYRVARLAPFPLAGGNAAISEPWRIAQGFISKLKLDWTWPEPYIKQAEMINHMLNKNINCHYTSSCGRLFDAISALLGLCYKTTYEGQAAICLQKAQEKYLYLNPKHNVQTLGYAEEDGAFSIPYGIGASGLWELDTTFLFKKIYSLLKQKKDINLIAHIFHTSLIKNLAELSSDISKQLQIKYFGLSGGVFQNTYIAGILPQELNKRKLEVLSHKILPPNDACISFGQAAWANMIENAK